jgi:hypothetical protein
LDVDQSSAAVIDWIAQVEINLFKNLPYSPLDSLRYIS